MLDISRDMYIRTILTYHFTLIGRTTIKTKQKITSVVEDVEKLEPSYIASGNVKQFSCCEDSLVMSQKVKHRTTI